MGAELWGDTAVVLPGEQGEGRGYRNVFTDERYAVVARGDQRVLAVGEILGTFPVALLDLEA